MNDNLVALTALLGIINKSRRNAADRRYNRQQDEFERNRQLEADRMDKARTDAAIAASNAAQKRDEYELQNAPLKPFWDTFKTWTPQSQTEFMNRIGGKVGPDVFTQLGQMTNPPDYKPPSPVFTPFGMTGIQLPERGTKPFMPESSDAQIARINADKSADIQKSTERRSVDATTRADHFKLKKEAGSGIIAAKDANDTIAAYNELRNAYGLPPLPAVSGAIGVTPGLKNENTQSQIDLRSKQINWLDFKMEDMRARTNQWINESNARIGNYSAQQSLSAERNDIARDKNTLTAERNKTYADNLQRLIQEDAVQAQQAAVNDYQQSITQGIRIGGMIGSANRAKSLDLADKNLTPDEKKRRVKAWDTYITSLRKLQSQAAAGGAGYSPNPSPAPTNGTPRFKTSGPPQQITKIAQQYPNWNATQIKRHLAKGIGRNWEEAAVDDVLRRIGRL